jgi:hypothetical protein
MRIHALLLAALAITSCVAAAPRESAVIVNSGSTNSYGYSIEVWSDGTASVTMQRRGSATGTPKPFTVPTATATRFFADLAAARKGNLTTGPCMKSASFGTTMRVTWQGWTSPDLSCPGDDSAGDALIADVAAIRQAAGLPEMPLVQSPPL